jgi:glycosyltransferase involved in cell wall biosynthesis
MRLLHILSTPRAEGTPNLVLDWLNVATLEHTHEIFVLHRSPPDLSAELREKATWYGDAELHTGRGWRKLARITAAVRRVCKERRPDLVICWAAGFAGWIAIALRMAVGSEARLIIHCGNPPQRGSGADWISRAVLLPVWWLGGQCVCCSDYVRDSYRRVPGLPVKLFVTIYNCARTEVVKARALSARNAHRAALSDAPKRTSIYGVMVATMEAHKDHETLLRALPDVLKYLSNFRLRLIGDGTLRPKLEALTALLNLEDTVEFLGSRRDVPEWLGRADIFVFSTTEQEGFGSVLIEALAVGLPIVASDVPACREILRDGKYGRLVTPASVSALATGIVAELSHPVSTPLESIAYATSFSPQEMLRRYCMAASEER